MYEKILLTLDGSTFAEQARDHATNLAERLGSELFLLRVVEPLVRSYRGGSAPPSALQSVERQLLEMAEEYLQNVAEETRGRGIRTQVAVRSGSAYKEIMSFVQANEIDVIVMCSCGEGGLARWLLGSVADHVVRGTLVPVLVVPPRRASDSR
jgi:nucleotide-binding universal stress UspA family protein